ncbi:hypothetical protein GCM10023205_77230 [Yinghuangia aomiensis]|uniref:Uncharacterized protein n=1 Tax=Yinghuangia aomiensis TaxID=676205 RepID=A0ABP9IAG5_9ACTN
MAGSEKTGDLRRVGDGLVDGVAADRYTGTADMAVQWAGVRLRRERGVGQHGEAFASHLRITSARST